MDASSIDVSNFLAARTEEILAAAAAAIARRHLDHYERLGRDETARRLRELLDRVIEAAHSRHLSAILGYAERVGTERYDSGFELVEVLSAFNLLEEAIWRAILDGCPATAHGAALGVVATILGAAKDRLASTYLSRATERHVPTLDLTALFGGTQNTGGGANGH
jgi:hypothetical protein